MITVELTEDHIEILTEGALRYGRMAIGVQAQEGDDVIVVYSQTHRRGRPPKSRAKEPRRPAAPPDPDILPLSEKLLAEAREQEAIRAQ
jgi:hypothetical protein